MSGSGRGWTDLVREVGEAFLALLRAELRALAGDLGRNGRGLLRVLLLAASAVAAGFWGVALLLDLAVEVLALWLPRWGAMSLVLALLVVVAGVLAAVSRARWRALEPPAETLRRRLEESRAWWRERIETEVAPEEGEP